MDFSMSQFLDHQVSLVGASPRRPLPSPTSSPWPNIKEALAELEWIVTQAGCSSTYGLAGLESRHQTPDFHTLSNTSPTLPTSEPILPISTFTERSIHQCPMCPYSTKRYHDCVKHIRTHTGERPFPCALCGLRFITKSALSDHKLIHSGQRLFTCEVCGRSFRARSSLRKHRFIHDPHHNIPCTKCDKTFTQAANLKRHMRRLHPHA